MAILRQASGGGGWDYGNAGGQTYGRRGHASAVPHLTHAGGTMVTGLDSVFLDPTIAAGDKFRIEFYMANEFPPAGGRLQLEINEASIGICRLGDTPSGPLYP
jgi:hypothetical protein